MDGSSLCWPLGACWVLSATASPTQGESNMHQIVVTVSCRLCGFYCIFGLFFLNFFVIFPLFLLISWLFSCHLGSRKQPTKWGYRLNKFHYFERDDFWEVDLDSNFLVFRVRRFTEWPGPLHWIAFPVEILTKPLIHWIPPPFSLKTPFFFYWKVLRRIPCPKIGSDYFLWDHLDRLTLNNFWELLMQVLRFLLHSACDPLCCKNMCCASRFARVVGELWAADPSNVQGPVKQNARPGDQSEAPRPRWKPGQEQNPAPGNQDSQHMREQPRGSFPDTWPSEASARVPLQNLVMKFFPEISPVLLCRVMGTLGRSFCWSFFCSECPSKTSPKTSWKTSR